MANIELQFEMAMRDQVIHNQREAQRNLWNLIMGLEIDEKQLLDLAAKQGITIEDWTSCAGLLERKESSNSSYGRCTRMGYSPVIGHLYARSSSVFQQNSNFTSSSISGVEGDPAPRFLREEHHSSYDLLSHDHSPSAYLKQRKSEQWVNGRPGSRSDSPGSHIQVRKSCSEIETQCPPFINSCMPATLCNAESSQQYKVCMSHCYNQPF